MAALRLKTELCDSVCVSGGVFPPQLFTATAPVAELPADHAELILQSVHGYLFEIDDSVDEDSELEAARARYVELIGKPASAKLKLSNLLALIEQAEKEINDRNNKDEQ